MKVINQVRMAGNRQWKGTRRHEDQERATDKKDRKTREMRFLFLTRDMTAIRQVKTAGNRKRR